MDFAVSTSHTVMVASSEPDTMRRPLGEYAVEGRSLVGVECHGSSPGLSTADDIGNVLLTEPDTIWRLSGETLTAFVGTLCAGNGPWTMSYVWKSHTMILSLIDPVAMGLLSGEKDRDGMPCMR